MGYKYSTVGGITVAVADMDIPEAKYTYIKEAEALVDKYEKAYRRGLISDDERYEKVIETWTETTEKVTDALMDGLDRMNNIFIMFGRDPLSYKGRKRADDVDRLDHDFATV